MNTDRDTVTICPVDLITGEGGVVGALSGGLELININRQNAAYRREIATFAEDATYTSSTSNVGSRS